MIGWRILGAAGIVLLLTGIGGAEASTYEKFRQALDKGASCGQLSEVAGSGACEPRFKSNWMPLG